MIHIARGGERSEKTNGSSNSAIHRGITPRKQTPGPAYKAA